MDLADLTPDEIQEIVVITPQSIARHCGLTNDPSNPDVRSEERRIRDLERQVHLSRIQDLPSIKHPAA